MNCILNNKYNYTSYIKIIKNLDNNFKIKESLILINIILYSLKFSIVIKNIKEIFNKFYLKFNTTIVLLKLSKN